MNSYGGCGIVLEIPANAILKRDFAHRLWNDVLLTRRIIPCLDVDGGRVVKGTSFVNLRDAGDPAELAARYDAEGGDELVFLDITASSDSRNTMVNVVQRVSEQVFIPLTVGGGIRSIEDVRRMLNAGADKVSINTAAINTPELVARGHGPVWQPVHRGGN